MKQFEIDKSTLADNFKVVLIVFPFLLHGQKIIKTINLQHKIKIYFPFLVSYNRLTESLQQKIFTEQ